LIVGDRSTVITGGGTIAIGRSAAGMATINGVNALVDGSAANTGFIIGLAASGRLILQAGALNYNGVAGLIVGGTGGNGELDVWGGTVTASVLGCGQNGFPTAGLVIITNGVVNAGTFRFDYGANPGAGSGTLQMSGGSLYIGNGGITNNNGAGTFTYAINLSGGTVGATTSWDSSLDMNLANDNGGITFQAADAGGNAQVISLSGSLSGLGGLIKTGSGTLLLNGNNFYSGTTLVSTGALGGTGVISGPVAVAPTGTLAPGASIGTLTINNDLTISGNLFIEVDRTASPSNDFVNVSGALANAGTGTVMVTNVGTSALAVGDSFTLFNQLLVNGNALTVIGAGAVWTNKLAYDGSIAVVSLLPPPNFSPGGAARLPDGNISLTATGGLGALYKLWASTNVALTPVTTTWTLLSSGTVTTSPFTISDLNATNYLQRFYLFSAP
jgi:autotransporter-associated beta strand protein